MTPLFATLAWPLSRLDEAVELLARHTGHPPFAPAATAALTGAGMDDPVALGRAIERLLSAHGLEVEPCVVSYAGVDRLPAPLILRIPDDSTDVAEPSFVVIARTRRKWLTMLGIDRRWHRASSPEFAAALRAPLEAPQSRDVERLLDAVSVPQSRRRRVSRALLSEQLADAQVTDAWRIVVEPGGNFVSQLRRAGIGRGLTALLALHATQFALWILSWGLIGRGALEGRTDWGWLTAWGLLLATLVPLQLWTTWMQGSLALGAGRLLKERLLVGALRMDPEDIRHQGAGQLLGRTLESHAVESLAIGGGLQAGLASRGNRHGRRRALVRRRRRGSCHPRWPARSSSPPLAAAAYHRQRTRWSESRLAMTHELVERVTGHRTRLAQEVPQRWHREEDRSLEEYLVRSSALDKWSPRLLVALPRGWITIAIGVLAPAFVTGAPAELLAVSLGGVLLASLALRRFADGLSQLSGAAIAWQQARPLFDAAAHRPSASAIADDAPRRHAPTAAVLDVRDVSYRYPGRPAPVLHGCTLRAVAGERLLLQGRSGGGKSTFASIVAGLRAPNAGLVLVDGLDRRTVGAHGWRRRVVAAPQFHENHVFCETFAFNLLMGRRWPATDADFRDAEDIARELGLGDLLARMPAGLLQMVGEGGWQLSHGERSRLYMARALLQGGEVMILDESFAALDPENLRETLECVLRVRRR